MSAVLSGSTVLVVEDEPFIALDVAELLETAGCRVLGPFGCLEEGLEAAEKGNFDLAVLDVKLRGAAVWPLAQLLRARGVPFVFLTGYSMIENFEHVIGSISHMRDGRCWTRCHSCAAGRESRWVISGRRSPQPPHAEHKKLCDLCPLETHILVLPVMQFARNKHHQRARIHSARSGFLDRFEFSGGYFC